MKVYEISALGKPKDRRFKEYAGLLAEDAAWAFITPDGEGLNGVPYGEKWKTQAFCIDKPLAPRQNFLWIGGRAFVCDEKARELAGEPLEMSGEFLPISVEGEKGQYWIYNITNCINVVDTNKCEWEEAWPGSDERVLEKLAFIPSRFGEETLFKIPEDRATRLYCAEFTGDPEDGEFKAVVEQCGLTGLHFDPVWSDGLR